ncbi:MAG: RnfABCDGE type electron transport complex subunit B [Oscillospiraceae bacterium]|jgi:Na+-translocating ferredoxin:NAD+ oxidoreductase RNF subunit RnfB|nr:RnfABCDGE type electron transport complex subunit B [Oscillospiraceae bacterium]
MNPILLAVLSVAAIGAVCAVLLVAASKLMYVRVDERVAQIRDTLPGANCGACGFTGCDGYSKALADGDAETNLCVPGGDAVSREISGILGVGYKDVLEMVAAVRCGGAPDVRGDKMEYDGITTCAAAKMYYGGAASCQYGCIGYGDCAAQCPTGAICIEDGIARVNLKLCAGCGMCARVCPNNLIWIHDDTITTLMICSSHDKGADTRRKCSAGCIACRKCEHECPVGAISMDNNLAVIDYSVCIGCGRCAEVCTTKCMKIALFTNKARIDATKAAK